jgi:transcriptional regulator with XRE-family HTH domain
MARKEAVPQRERGICFRLREFRLSTKIPRTTFALTVGISGERLASYELGRVPLRYGVFKAINRHFHIRLDWLMNNRGTLTSPTPLDDSQFASQINEKELLSVVYDTVLSKHSDPDKEDLEAFFFGPGGLDARLSELERIVTNPKETKKLG